MKVTSSKSTDVTSVATILTDENEEMSVVLRTEVKNYGFPITVLNLERTTFCELEISQLAIAIMKLLQSQKDVIDFEIIEGLNEACLEFMGTKGKCCENPQLSNAYLNSVVGRLKDVIVCDNCGSIMEEE